MNPINLNVSKLFATARQTGVYLELQDQPLYSLVTLPTPLTTAGGVQFFGDTISTVTPSRTNMDRPNQVPIGTTFELHGFGLRFLAPLTVVYSSFNTAMRDAWMEFQVNQSLRDRIHLTQYIPASIVAPSFSAAAGDNPVVTSVGLDMWVPLALPIEINDQTNFRCTIFFATDVAALNATVMGMYLGGILNRGNVKLNNSPSILAQSSMLQ